ncbi:MAG TPA: helix-hairpin-helix domain-containing protein, partial [Polyangiaceae bacterium]
DGSARDALVSAYAKLAEQMPSVFALEGERGQREAVIVHALLQQVPDVRKVTIDKIYAAGLTSLDVLLTARPDEIAATTGIGEALAERIAQQFRRYREDAKKLSDARHDAEKKRLAELLVAMREAHDKFEASAAGWSGESQAQKKEFRQARVDVLLQIKVILARLGEVERLSELERLPFGRKIEELEKYLRENKVELSPAKT